MSQIQLFFVIKFSEIWSTFKSSETQLIGEQGGIGAVSVVRHRGVGAEDERRSSDQGHTEDHEGRDHCP